MYFYKTSPAQASLDHAAVLQSPDCASLTDLQNLAVEEQILLYPP